MNDNNVIIHSTLEDGYDFFISDKWNKKYHFKIATFAVPPGLLSEALEVLVENSDFTPRVFHVLSNFDSDIEKNELELKGKIKKGINKRYIIEDKGDLLICNELQVAGRIEYSNELIDSNFDCFFQIDGRKITIEKFTELLKGVEGWNFKFQIIDTSEDID